MALDFGKLDFSTSFSPNAAFPLDARTYFESYAAAEAAAASAAQAGSSDSVYYFGQTLVVVENDQASFYIITPEKKLQGISSITVNPELFEYDNAGNLSLKGFDTAALNQVMSIDEDGHITWIDVYTQAQTDAKIKAEVANAAHLKRKIVASLAEINLSAADADQYIYMVPTGLEEEANKYYEYVVMVITDEEGETTRFVEKVGSWDVDLSEYATKEELKKKVDASENARLITNEEAEKLAGLEPALIKSVDEGSFAVSEVGKLTLNDLPVTKITNLDDILNKGSKTTGGYYLISQSDKDKLEALVISTEDGSLSISGKVNASNVEELDKWITEHSTGENFVSGLSANSLTNERLAQLEAAITSADEKNFTVEAGKLGLKAVEIAQVTDLADKLNNLVTKTQFTTLEISVGKNTDDIAELMAALTWTNI